MTARPWVRFGAARAARLQGSVPALRGMHIGEWFYLCRRY